MASDCNFIGLKILNGSLERCSFTSCKFEEAGVTGTRFSEVSFVETELLNCEMTDVSMDKCLFKNMEFPDWYFSSLQIQASQFVECKLPRAVFSGGNYEGCGFLSLI